MGYMKVRYMSVVGCFRKHVCVFLFDLWFSRSSAKNHFGTYFCSFVVHFLVCQFVWRVIEPGVPILF